MEGNNDRMRGFICDEMLKKLCRWLRIAGYDVLSPAVKGDEELVKLCLEEERILLTRDRDLSNRRDAHALRILSDDLDGQIREFLEAFLPDRYPRSETRCALCNGEIESLRRDEIEEDEDMKNMVPNNVLLYHNTYFRCRSCGKLYWKGSHWKKIMDRLERLSITPRLPGEP